MWLLDANMDVHLVSLLADLGISAESAIGRGWSALDNGDLVGAAVEQGFTCLLTQDRLFGKSAAKALKEGPNFSVVVVRLPQKPWRDYLKQFRAAWHQGPIVPNPGRLLYWPE